MPIADQQTVAAPGLAADDPITSVPGRLRSRIQWSCVIAGAIAAAALGFVLHSFALTLGLAVSSSDPTWRDTSFALVLLTGLYLLLTSLAEYGVGGYVAGRLRSRFLTASNAEVEYCDGMHGILAWGLATLVTALLALATIQALPRSASFQPPRGEFSIAGEGLIAYELDELFRTTERRAPSDITYTRAEAARILLRMSGHRGLQQEDRAYLVRLVAANTGISQAEADRRVELVIARANEDIHRARRSAVILGFMIGTAALLGAVVAWFAACAGGKRRDGSLDIPWLLARNASVSQQI